MNSDNILNTIRKESENAIKICKQYLDTLNLDIDIDNDYNFSDEEDEQILGVYESFSVFEGQILIALNIPEIIKVSDDITKDWQVCNVNRILKETLFTTIFHEMGHGLAEKISDYISSVEECNKIYENNKELLDNILNNEEKSVEEFSWDFYDGDVEDNGLYKAANLFLL